MKLFLICAALMVPGFCRAEVPKLLTERPFTSASLAEAANHYINLGEQATFNELQAFLAADSARIHHEVRPAFSVDERIAWLFRILYVPRDPVPMHVAKTGAWLPGSIVPLRSPKFGWLELPETSMPAEKWPLYPLTLSGSTFIVLEEKYTPRGEAETINHYMEYCKNTGAFRKTPVPVPTREQAMNDVEQLKQSSAWKAINWLNNGGTGFPNGEEWTWPYIQKQASGIPEAPVANKQTNAVVTQVSTR